MGSSAFKFVHLLKYIYYNRECFLSGDLPSRRLFQMFLLPPPPSAKLFLASSPPHHGTCRHACIRSCRHWGNHRALPFLCSFCSNEKQNSKRKSSSCHCRKVQKTSWLLLCWHASLSPPFRASGECLHFSQPLGFFQPRSVRFLQNPLFPIASVEYIQCVHIYTYSALSTNTTTAPWPL